jgi:hypothetical protein
MPEPEPIDDFSSTLNSLKSAVLNRAYEYFDRTGT